MDEDENNLEVLEQKVYSILHCSLNLIHTRFIAFRNKHSPKVAVVQSNMNIHEPATKEEREVERMGYLSCHLCLNAQTEEQHTEPDASYTIIAVPKKIDLCSKNDTSNKAQFEFMLNDNLVIIVSMHPGTIIPYSGYILTHRQQIVDLDALSLPFVNIVAYNSKRLFANLTESFRRDINEDKKSKSQKK